MEAKRKPLFAQDEILKENVLNHFYMLLNPITTGTAVLFYKI